MKSKMKFFEEETSKFQAFIEQHDGSVLDESNVDTILAPQDNFSKQ